MKRQVKYENEQVAGRGQQSGVQWRLIDVREVLVDSQHVASANEINGWATGRLIPVQKCAVRT